LGSLVLVAGVSFEILRQPQLDPDDFRYFAVVRELEDDFWAALPEAFVVENRWDHIWWMDAQSALRFFRPTVVLSYWMDSVIYPDRDRGLLLTNVLLHLACTWLCWLILARLIEPGVPALVGTLLFAGLFCHGEVIWYVAGRTDTLAAFGFLAALAAFLSFSHVDGWKRFLSIPFFALALFSKELAVVLPVLCLFYDISVERWSGGLKRFWRERGWLYGTFGIVISIYFLARWWALAAGDGTETGWVFPYLVSPWDPRFLPHVWTQLWIYAENLSIARLTPPFLQPSQLSSFVSLGGLVVSVIGIGLLGISALKDRRAHFFLLLAFLTWLPTSVVYVSERYLYLPSLALVGLAALAVDRWRGRRIIQPILIAALLFWGVNQTLRLREKNSVIANWGHRSVAEIEHLFDPVGAGIAQGARLLVLDFPLDWLSIQFLGPILQDRLGNPDLSVRVLTQAHTEVGPEARLQLRRVDESGLLVGRNLGLLDRSPSLFGRIDLSAGVEVEREVLPFVVRILEGSGSNSSRVAFELEDPLEHYVLVWYRPAGPILRHPYGWEAPGEFEILSIPPAEVESSGRAPSLEPSSDGSGVTVED
jgi:hypothetical protein